jgi:hypothetical protein
VGSRDGAASRQGDIAHSAKDNDTVGAIVGAAVGALHGRAAVPQNWIDGFLGRTTADDDGRKGG